MVFLIHLYKCLILSDHVFRLLVWNFNHYKNSMKKDFIEDGKIFNEEFTDESLICYETIKVIERFK